MQGVRRVWSRWLHTAALARGAVPLFVLLLSVAGFVVTTRLVDADRSSAARQSAASDAAQVRGLLQQAATFSTGLASALEGEAVSSVGRFQALEGSAAAAVGLTQAMWVEPVTSSGRSAYERRIGAPITQLPGTRPAGTAATYLPATFITGLPFPPGVDVSSLPALAATLRNPLSVFAGTATPVGTLAGQLGFFLVQETRFGQGQGSSGFLIVFVPGGWLNSSLGTAANQIAISQDGRRLAGTFDATPAAGATFDELTQAWGVGVAPVPPTTVQRALPALAFSWPLATALVVYLVGRGTRRRRRAEREIANVYDLSLDLLCILGVDGYLKRVNPAFERTLGYEAAELLSRPLLEFIHTDDRQAMEATIARLQAGRGAERFESRYVRSDGVIRRLEWSARPMIERGLIYSAARDVTDARMLMEELAMSRRRIVAAADETRRRVERDLHDGAQQRLVSTVLTLKRARHAVDSGAKDAAELIEAAVVSTERVFDELRELARGIHPAILSAGGLAPALKGIARRCPIPVELDLQIHDRLPERIEVTAYYVVSEALTNAAKHSRASVMHVTATVTDSNFRLSISDDGVGGADPAGGTGLVGLKDRVEAAYGTLTVESPPGKGTHLTIELPMAEP
jgi:PAS domain S-box-containing protein